MVAWCTTKCCCNVPLPHLITLYVGGVNKPLKHPVIKFAGSQEYIMETYLQACLPPVMTGLCCLLILHSCCCFSIECFFWTRKILLVILQWWCYSLCMGTGIALPWHSAALWHCTDATNLLCIGIHLHKRIVAKGLKKFVCFFLSIQTLFILGGGHIRVKNYDIVISPLISLGIVKNQWIAWPRRLQLRMKYLYGL